MNNVMILDNIVDDNECDNLIKRTESLMGNEMPPPWNYVYYDFPYDDSVSVIGENKSRYVMSAYATLTEETS